MKSLVICSLMAASLAVFSQSTLAAEPKAVQIDIGSIGGKLDTAAIRAIRQIVGYNVASGVVDDFNVYSPKKGNLPIEGGLSACAGAGFNVSNSRFNGFINELKTIKPKSGTFYNLSPKDACSPPVPVFCTLDVKQCPDGSFVGRVPPSCAFKPCPSVK